MCCITSVRQPAALVDYNEPTRAARELFQISNRPSSRFKRVETVLQILQGPSSHQNTYDRFTVAGAGNRTVFVGVGSAAEQR